MNRVMSIRILTATAFGAIALGSLPLRAAILPVIGTVTGGSAHEEYGMNPSGYDFTPTQDVYVTELGYYSAGPNEDSATNDLGASHEVQIFTYADGDIANSIAVTPIVTVTPSSTVIGQFAYESLTTPVKLTAGVEYVISGTQEGPPVASYNGGNNIDPLVQGASFGTNLITFNGGSYWDGGTDSPHYPNNITTNGSQGTANIGPNLLVTPEPASFAMLGVGALGLLARRRRGV